MLAVSSIPDPEGQANPQARHTGLEREAVRGIRWTFLAYAGTRMLGVAAMLVLARLLVPRDFGLVAFAALVIQLVVHFTGLGLGPALVIRPGLGRRALGTIETSMLVLGPFSAAVVLALSPIAAGLIGDRRLVGVLAVLTIPVAFGGVTSSTARYSSASSPFAPSLRACWRRPPPLRSSPSASHCSTAESGASSPARSLARRSTRPH